MMSVQLAEHMRASKIKFTPAAETTALTAVDALAADLLRPLNFVVIGL